MDPVNCAGLFTYGPTHHIGTNAEDEIDIEFSQWNKTCHGCNADLRFILPPVIASQRGFPRGNNFRSQRRNSDYREDGVVSGPHRIHADEWGSAHRNVVEVIKTENTPQTQPTFPRSLHRVASILVAVYKQTPAQEQSVVIRKFEFVAH